MSRLICRGGRWSVAPLRLGLGLVLATFSSPEAARADRILLRGGGQIRGKLIADPADPDHLMFVGELGKNPIIYKKAQILQVRPENSVLDEYVELRAQDRPLAEEEYQLGDWCAQHKLKDLAENHFEAALRLDPGYGPAHEKLGHAFVGDRWLNADEQLEAQGMVKFKGRWIRLEEKQRIDDQAALVAENQSWVRRIRIFRDAFVAGPDARSREAETQLLQIREVIAVGPVALVLGEDDNPSVRNLATRVLGAIPGPEASAALVTRLLGESDRAIRESTVLELTRRQADEVTPRLVRALRSSRAEMINRAAWALARLNATTAVPQLIAALTLIEYRTEMVPVNRGGGGGLNSSFNSVAPAGNVGFSNGTSRNYLAITPPVVGPGVVAYGVTGVPITSGVALGSNAVNGGIGAGAGNPRVSLIPRIIPVEHPNVEVLAALVKLTGQNYGYNVPTWKSWAAAAFRSDKTPSRQVVNP